MLFVLLGVRVLDRLEGRDVFLFIVESYSCTLYSEPAHFAVADSTLAAGVRIVDQAAHAALLESEVKPMAARFNEAGYLAGRRALIVVAGDHQPYSGITGQRASLAPCRSTC